MTALGQFLQQFPSGWRSSAAQQLLLETYLASFPDRTGPINALGQSMITAVPAGFERWAEQARLADLLASSGEAGVNLDQARQWAQDAVTLLSEESYRREMTVAQARYKLPRIPQKQMHAQYTEYRASFLAALAAVELRRGEPEHAAPLLTEAFRLQPLSGEVNALEGQLALAQGNSQAALQSFERADALGALHQPWRARELQLFTQLQHGDANALTLGVDEVYRRLFPAPFTLPHRQLAPGGHTVLLELFTGSGCAPCAGPDLAVDSLLGSYSRQDLVVLAFDEHIPRPDPLTTPDTVRRAGTYRVQNTPAAFLDGQPLEILGASRGDVENIVVGFADEIEAQAALPSGLGLQLVAGQDADGTVRAQPVLAVKPVPAAQAAGTTGDMSLRTLARAVLYVALVQDNVRYSGENGVRLHRMLARSITELPVATYLHTDPQPSPVLYSPGELDRAQDAYLTEYERHNDRFGAFRFATEPLPIAGGDLAVVAWVQDPLTHHVLQAAYATVQRK